MLHVSFHDLKVAELQIQFLYSIYLCSIYSSKVLSKIVRCIVSFQFLLPSLLKVRLKYSNINKFCIDIHVGLVFNSPESNFTLRFYPGKFLVSPDLKRNLNFDVTRWKHKSFYRVGKLFILFSILSECTLCNFVHGEISKGIFYALPRRICFYCNIVFLAR